MLRRLVLVLLLGFTAPVYAGELDGKGIVCTNEESGNVLGYYFKEGLVERWSPYGIGTPPLPHSLRKDVQEPYSLHPQHMFWSDSEVHYYLDRKTLILTYFQSIVSYCRVVDSLTSLHDALQPELEKIRKEIKEKMKDNKI